MQISKLIIKLLKSLYSTVHPLAEYGKSTKDFEEGKVNVLFNAAQFFTRFTVLVDLGEEASYIVFSFSNVC